jgi:DNA polymerase-3 subunit alpha
VGTISYVKERKSQKGKNFAFVGLTDPNNQFEITVFSELLFKARDILVPGNSILVEIETQRNSDNFRLLASKLSLLNETPKSINSEEKCAYLRVYIDKSDAIVSIKENLIQEGDTEISICLFLDNDSNFETELSLGKNFLINSSIIESIKNIDGVSKIEEI